MGKERLDNLTTLRFFAAFSVFLHHLTPFGLDVSKHVWHLNLGWTVSFFYVLSGFVLAYSYEGRIQTKTQAARFAAVRFFRLWPLHIACVVLALLVRPVVPDFDKFYLLLTLQHSWIPRYDTAFYINAVSWSISVELAFYIAFAVLMLFPAKFGRIALAWTAAMLGLLVIASTTNWLPFSANGVSAAGFFHLSPAVRIVEFFTGIGVARLYRSTRVPDRLVPFAQAAAIVAMVAYASVHAGIFTWLRQEYGSAGVWYQVAGPFLLFAVVIYAFAHQTGPISTALSNRWLLYLGETSFALYMVHQVVIEAARMWLLPTGVSPALLGLYALVVSLAAASLLHRHVELPPLAWARRTFEPPRQRHGPSHPLAP